MYRLNQDALALIVIAALALGSVRASAQQRSDDDETTSIVVRDADTHPQSRRAARVLLSRVSEAAMAVCGASQFSLRECRQSVRASACWRDAMQSTLARIDDRTLSETYDADERARRNSLGAY